MNENFGPAPNKYSAEEMLALEGYTPESLQAFREETNARIEAATRASLAEKLNTQEYLELASPEKILRNVTVLLGNGKLITFKKVADLDFGNKNAEGFTGLFLLGENDQVVAQFEPTTWAAYYYSDHCQGIV